MLTINSATTLDNVRLLSTGNTLSVSGIGPLTGLTIGSLVATNIVGSSGSYTFDMPTITNGMVMPNYGIVTATASDGTTTTTNTNITLLPPINYDVVTVSNWSNTNPGYLPYYLNNYGFIAGSVISIRNPTSLNVLTNTIGTDGKIQTDYFGNQTLYLRNLATGFMHILTISTPGTPSAVVSDFNFTETFNSVSDTIVSSNEVNIVCTDVGQLIPISVSNGLFSINNGVGYSVPSNIATYVYKGSKIKANILTPNTDNIKTTATLSVGNISNKQFSTTTGFNIKLNKNVAANKFESGFV